MQNLNKEKICSFVFQQDGRNFKYFLSFCLLGLLFFSSNVLLAQPNSFTIASCNATANGDYTRNVQDVNGCPCYDKADSRIMLRVGANWSVSINPASCTGSGFVTSPIYTAGSDQCDISTATSDSCDPATTLSLPSVSSPSNVPTLSEWGLIILALLLMILGTLVLMQPSTRFEQEG